MEVRKVVVKYVNYVQINKWQIGMKTMPFITKLSSLGYLSNMHPLPPENRNQTVIAVSFQPLGENIYFCYSLRVYYQLNGSCLSIDVQHKFNFGIVFFIDMDWPLEWTVGDNHCRKKHKLNSIQWMECFR